MCWPEGRVISYDYTISQAASSIPVVEIAGLTVVGVSDTSEMEEEEIHALSLMTEVSTVEEGGGIIHGGK